MSVVSLSDFIAPNWIQALNYWNLVQKQEHYFETAWHSVFLWVFFFNTVKDITQNIAIKVSLLSNKD